MKSLIIYGIMNGLNLLSSYLNNKDDNNVGWDDTLARILDYISQLVNLVDEDKAISKKSILICLEIVETILENIDENTEGIDDYLAEQIGEIKKAIDLG